jgi:hypothetical protein
VPYGPVRCSSIAAVSLPFREICAVEMDDRVVSGVAGLAVDLGRGEFEYGGLRIKTHAEIAGTRVRIVIDIALAMLASQRAGRRRGRRPCC